MTLIRDAYRAEILGGLAAAGEEVLHVSVDPNGSVPGAVNRRDAPR